MSAELDDLYENAWHSVAKPPRRRSGIISEMPLSMRVPSVSPANDDNLCREMPLFEWWEKYPRGKEGVLLFRVYAVHSCRGRITPVKKLYLEYLPTVRLTQYHAK